MRLSQIMVAMVLVGMMLVGCRSTPKTLDAEGVKQVRSSYTKIDPNARLGVVIAVLPEKGLVAVGDLQVADFSEGDVLVLLDKDQKVIGAGTVVAKTADALHVKYDVATPKGREPVVGDLAVRSK